MCLYVCTYTECMFCYNRICVCIEYIFKPYKLYNFSKIFPELEGGGKYPKKSIQIHISLKLYVILKVSKEQQFRAYEFLGFS